MNDYSTMWILLTFLITGLFSVVVLLIKTHKNTPTLLELCRTPASRQDDYKWYKTTCSCCGKEFEVKISKKRYKENPLLTAGCTCFKCVSETSLARNGIDEDCYEHKE